MAKDTIEEILEARRKPEPPATPDADKFYSVISAEGLQENFLELQFKSGLRTCFSFGDLIWFNYEPDEGCIDMEFGGFLVTVKGRALYPALFQAIKGKRVAWMKEADSELQDHEGNECYIAEITVTPPKGFGGDEEGDEKAAG